MTQKKTHWKAARQILDAVWARARLGLAYGRGDSLDVDFVYGLGTGGVDLDAGSGREATETWSVLVVVTCWGAPVARLIVEVAKKCYIVDHCGRIRRNGGSSQGSTVFVRCPVFLANLGGVAVVLEDNEGGNGLVGIPFSSSSRGQA